MVIPFELKNAPSIFSKIVVDAFKCLPDVGCMLIGSSIGMDLFFVEMAIQPYFQADLQWSHMQNINLPKVGKILFCILRNTRKLPKC